MLCSPALASFAESKLLDFSDPGQLTLHINIERCVSRAIYGIGLIIIRMREGYEGGVWGRDRDSYARPSVLVSMVRPAKCVSLSSSQFSEALYFL